MNLRILKKSIYYLFVLININHPLFARNFYLLEPKKNNQSNSLIWRKVNSKTNVNSSDRTFVKYVQDLKGHPSLKNSGDIRYQNENKIVNYTDEKNGLEIKYKNEDKSVNYKDKKNELEIKSDSQSEKNNILYATGNVLVSYKGKFLTAENIVYDKNTKILNANENIKLIIGDQIFKMNEIEYDFVNQKGYMSKVKGLINTKNFVDDIIADFSKSDIQKIESLLKIQKEKVKYTPGRVENWIFSTDQIIIDRTLWKIEKAVFTNDLLEQKQAKIEINSLEITTENKQIKFKSSLNYLVLEEKVGVPFWFRKRTLTKSSEGLDSKNSWNVGYDNLDKDGLFIGRNIKSINLSDDLSLSLEPQYLIQRASKGYTKSFVKKRDYILGERISRNTTFSDYFALNSEIKGKVNTWDLEIEKQINSFDFAKFQNAFRLKSTLSKDINFLNSIWKNSFYIVYRDRIWNGSLGEAEIYSGYGSKLEKRNTWETNGIKKTEVLSFGMANLEGEALHGKNLVSSLKGNVFYSFDQKFPISVDNSENNIIDSSYKYISEPIKKGLSLNTRIAGSSSVYEIGKHQEYVGFGAGPEFIMGNFKNKLFDYTRISFFPFYKIKSGDSLFKFDQISDKYTIDISFDQQLYGPLIVKSSAIFNLDSESNEYGDLINSKISLNWERRSYDLGIFYQPHNQAGGIGFSLFGFQ